MKKTMLLVAVAAVTLGAQAYQPAKSPLMTEWGEKMTPETAWREYPRPQMVRDNWTNLNGENYNDGFVSVCDFSYPELVEACRRTAAGMYVRKFKKGQ